MKKLAQLWPFGTSADACGIGDYLASNWVKPIQVWFDVPYRFSRYASNDLRERSK